MKKIVVVLLGIALMLCLAGCCFSHQWIEATCSTPKTCSECGKTEGTTKPHTWIAATCTSVKTCSVCAVTEGDCLPHSWITATCTTLKTCATCAMTEGEYLPHTWVEATCASPKTCTTCNAIEGEALSHVWAEATCTTPRTCSTCSATEGEPAGHTVNEWSASKESTCTEEGIEQGTCAKCGTVVEQNIPILNHSSGDWVITKEPTASEKGQRTKSCTICGDVLETEEFEMSPEEIEAAYKASCKKYTYKKIARSPGEYEGKRAVFTGKVIQVQQEELYGIMIYVLRVNVTKSGRYYSDTVYVTYYTTADAPRILEDDIITMYGELTGEKTYTTVMGASVTIPSFSAEYVDIQ